jgi:hypothetical protein
MNFSWLEPVQEVPAYLGNKLRRSLSPNIILAKDKYNYLMSNVAIHKKAFFTNAYD